MVRAVATALLIYALIPRAGPAFKAKFEPPTGPDVVVTSAAREWGRLRVMAWNTAERYGVDPSLVAAVIDLESGWRADLVHSDTGAELPETIWILPRIARYIGRPLHVVSNGTFFQHLTNYGFMLPGPVLRWCTRSLKQVSQDRFFQSVGAEEVYLGIRADEARRMIDRRSREGRFGFAYPLIEAGLGKADVKALCDKHGLLSPVYEWRTNTSCFCCPFQRKSDWLGLLHHHPELYALAEEWEKQSIATSGYTWNRSWSLEKMRRMDEAQIKLWPECEDEPCTICAL